MKKNTTKLIISSVEIVNRVEKLSNREVINIRYFIAHEIGFLSQFGKPTLFHLYSLVQKLARGQ